MSMRGQTNNKNNNSNNNNNNSPHHENVFTMHRSVTIVTPQRCNSMDYLNFEEKRQLIASSLSLSEILQCGPAAAAAHAAKEIAETTVIGKFWKTWMRNWGTILCWWRARKNYLGNTNLLLMTFRSIEKDLEPWSCLKSFQNNNYRNRLHTYFDWTS